MSVKVLDLVTTVNDALALAAALTPLVQQALAEGKSEVSAEDVAAARERLNAGIAALDAQIARARG